MPPRQVGPALDATALSALLGVLAMTDEPSGGAPPQGPPQSSSVPPAVGGRSEGQRPAQPKEIAAVVQALTQAQGGITVYALAARCGIEFVRLVAVVELLEGDGVVTVHGDPGRETVCLVR